MTPHPPRPKETVASYPRAYKHFFATELHGWDADLKVDYDTAKNPLTRSALRNGCRSLATTDAIPGEIRITKAEIARTGRGHHLRLWLHPSLAANPWPALAIQAAFGDDPKRQAFNAARVGRGESGWNVLWNQKWQNKKLTSKERYDPEWTRILRDIARRWDLL